MTVRNRIFITAILLCHLLVWCPLVTSQLRAAQNNPQTQPSGPSSALSTTSRAEEVTISALSQEKIGHIYNLRGEVHIQFREFDIHADEVTYNQSTGDISAAGHLVFDGGPDDLHMEGTRATYNAKSESGKFYDVVGTTGAKLRGRHVLLTSSNPFAFSGKLVEKSGKNRIIVHRGTVTSCKLEDPKWTFKAEKIDVVTGESAKLYHSTFRLEHIPIFYFPFATLPTERVGRQTGFLIPSIGQSSRKGTIVGDSFYWAINRSMDATIGAEYWSSRGIAEHGEFRARPSDTSFINLKFFGVNDRGFGNPKQTQGGQDVKLNAEAVLPWGFRGVANLNYLSSYVFRLAFSETFTQAVNSEVKSVAFASKSINGYFFNLMASRYQNFQSTNRGDLINIVHAPSIDLGSVDHKVGSTPIYFSYEASAQGVTRREPDFVTNNLVARLDVNPRISVPFHLDGWDLRPEIALQNTYYTQRRIPTSGVGVPGNDPINRRAFETSFEIRPPSVSKVFDKAIFQHKIKHTVEPLFVYRYVNGVDNFSKIIRFDAMDILSDTNEIQYGITHRIYAKNNKVENCGNPSEISQMEESSTPTGEGGASAEDKCGVGSREIISWEVMQKYFFNETFGNALVSGQRNVFTTTAELTGIAFLTEARHYSPIVSRLRIRTAKNTDVEWHFDYDSKKGRINASTALVNHRFGDFFIGGSQAYLQAPGEEDASTSTPTPVVFNQLRWLVGYGNPNKRGISAAANIGFDVNSRFLQYTAVQTSYNWDCCGFSVEYRRFALGSVRNENQFRFALSLTNIGTFGTLRRQERLF
jgi:LPS-assembly protein